MATFAFEQVLVWDATPDGSVRTLRGATVTVRHPDSGSVLTTAVSDTSGVVEFTTTDVPTVIIETANGFARRVTSEDASVSAFLADAAGHAAAAQAAADVAVDAAADAATQVGSLLSGGLLNPALLPGGTSLGDTGRRYRKVLGVLRNTGSGWVFINDAGHRPTGVHATTPVTVTPTGIVVSYGFTGIKVASVAVVPDETFAGLGLRVGPSVGLSDLTVQLFRDDPYTIADYVFYDGAAWVSFNGNFTPSYTSGTGTLTLTHEDMGGTGHQAIVATPRGSAAALAGGFTATTSQVVFGTGAWGSLVATGAANAAQHKVYVVRHGYRTAVPPVNPASVVSATGNLWVIGEFEVTP